MQCGSHSMQDGSLFERINMQQEAQNQLNKYQELNKRLYSIISIKNVFYQRIENIAQGLVDTASLDALKTIPIEEINRDKKGIRTKLLIDNGIVTMADALNATIWQLTAINGISEAGAYSIKRRAIEFFNTYKNGFNIKLNPDKKTVETSKLVQAIYVFRNVEPVFNEAVELYNATENKFRPAVTTLQNMPGVFAWYYTSQIDKELYIGAIDFLREQMVPLEASISELAIKAGKLIDTEEAIAWKDFEENSIEYYNILEKIVPELTNEGEEQCGLPELIAKPVSEVEYSLDGLKCTLRRYQEWGVRYILHQERVLLGDEMGLGKTVQAIASMVALRNTGETHFLVVCPASVISNWCREIAKFSDLEVIKMHGRDREIALNQWAKAGGVLVTTFETTEHVKIDENSQYCMCIVDEAHYIKNASAQRTQNVKKVCEQAKRLLFMTGTAIENNVEEMINLIQILQPEIAKQIKNKTYMASAPQFRDQIAPVYYRRKREDVLKELPDKEEICEWSIMNSEEEKAYEKAVLSKNYSAIRRVSWNVDDFSKSSKANRMLEIVKQAEDEKRKVIIFSFFLDTVTKVCQLLDDKAFGPITGSVAPAKRQEIIDDFNRAEQGSVLVAQIQSGGTGLNIQAASVVILCEPQLKPSIENQAIARAYRMGQARNVLVYRLLCDETVDERVLELLTGKQQIFDAFADKSTALELTEGKEVDEKSFGDIVQAEYERIIEKNNCNKE